MSGLGMSLDEMIASSEPEPSSHQQPWAARSKGSKKGNRTWTGPHKGSKVFDRDTVRQERAARQAEPSAAVGAVIESKMLPARSAAGGFGGGGGGGGGGASSTALPISTTFSGTGFPLGGPALCPVPLPMAGMAGFGAGGGGGAPGYVPAADPLGTAAGSLYTPPGFSSLQQQQQSLLAQLNGFPASSGAAAPTGLGGGVGAPPTALPAPSVTPGAPATKAVFSKADGGVQMSFAPETWPALITPVGAVAGAGAAQPSPLASGVLVGTPVSLPGADSGSNDAATSNLLDTAAQVASTMALLGHKHPQLDLVLQSLQSVEKLPKHSQARARMVLDIASAVAKLAESIGGPGVAGAGAGAAGAGGAGAATGTEGFPEAKPQSRAALKESLAEQRFARRDRTRGGDLQQQGHRLRQDVGLARRQAAKEEQLARMRGTVPSSARKSSVTHTLNPLIPGKTAVKLKDRFDAYRGLLGRQ
eukprot:Rhum_TRINITY_DN11380_c2_g1::Rhum_TRINITY_DN11380_c2_g1_i1::g.44275::m.44275